MARLALAVLVTCCCALTVSAVPRGYFGAAIRPVDVPPLPEDAGGPFEVAGEVVYLVPHATAARAG